MRSSAAVLLGVLSCLDFAHKISVDAFLPTSAVLRGSLRPDRSTAALLHRRPQVAASFRNAPVFDPRKFTHACSLRTATIRRTARNPCFTSGVWTGGLTMNCMGFGRSRSARGRTWAGVACARLPRPRLSLEAQMRYALAHILVQRAEIIRVTFAVYGQDASECERTEALFMQGPLCLASARMRRGSEALFFVL